MFTISSVNERSLCVNCGSKTPIIPALRSQWQEGYRTSLRSSWSVEWVPG